MTVMRSWSGGTADGIHCRAKEVTVRGKALKPPHHESVSSRRADGKAPHSLYRPATRSYRVIDVSYPFASGRQPQRPL